MSNYDIAVIIPMYNASKTILRALEGVFKQTVLPSEVILIDDGSTDDSLNIVNSSEYKHAVSVISITNSGPGNARNVGIKACKSELIAFLDADDEWICEDKLKKQRALIESNDKIVLVDTFAKVYWDENKLLDMTNVNFGSVFNKFLYKNIINATSSVLVKRSAVEKAGYFDPTIRFGEDRLLWALIAKHGQFATLEVFTVYKENHADNLTSKGEENFRYRKMIVTKLLSECELGQNAKVKVHLANIEDFLLQAYRSRDALIYQKLSREALSIAPLGFLFSRFAFLYIISLFFRFLPNR